MDIQKFQQKLTEVCELGEKNGKVLKPEQIKECFGELDLDKSQLIKILQYLKLKGISIEGAEEISAASQTGPEKVSEEKEEKVPLTAEEEAYLKEYLEGLEEQEQGERSAEELFELLSRGDALAQAELSQKYLRAAAEMAVEMNCAEIFIADLIQEANISLLMALGEEEPEEKDEKWLLGRIRCGIRHAIEEQTQRKFEDDYLVAKVEKLEAAVRELTEDEEDESSKFSVEELAIILDMDEEEIRDVLRLVSMVAVAASAAETPPEMEKAMTAVMARALSRFKMLGFMGDPPFQIFQNKWVLGICKEQQPQNKCRNANSRKGKSAVASHGQCVDMSVLNRDGQVIETRRTVNDLIRGGGHFAIGIADRQRALKDWLFQQLISFWGGYLCQTVLYFFICPKVFKRDSARFVRGELAVCNGSGCAALGKAVAVIHRLPCIAVLVLQQEGGPKQRLTIGILLGHGDGTRAAIILGGVQNLRVMLLHRPNTGVALIQQIALGRFRLLPHIGNAE